MAFLPYKANTVTVSATTTVSTTALTFDTPQSVCPTVMVKSLAGSADTVWIKFGGSAVTVVAGTSGMPIMPGERVVLQLGASDTHVACDCAASTATVYFTTGEGGD